MRSSGSRGLSTPTSVAQRFKISDDELRRVAKAVADDIVLVGLFSAEGGIGLGGKEGRQKGRVRE